ncbi:MAG: hypothetical protein ACE5Z5_12270 [Candidatus Bathyarchaeia archaeon]
MKIRDALYDHTELIDSFVAENPFNFSSGELEIVAGWRYLVKGTFYLLRYLKRYAIFLDDKTPPRAYGVLALTNTFEEILGQEPPIRLEAVLLPFKGKIVYDGFLVPYRIFFGRGIREELNDDYQEAKHRFGVITSLPPAGEREKTDSELLKFYLRNESNRLRYEEEIEKLTRKDFDLMKIYHQEMGKIHARKFGRRLREIGLREAWFAILEGTIIASGATKEEVNEVLKDILPKEKRELTYIFHLRKK